MFLLLYEGHNEALLVLIEIINSFWGTKVLIYTLKKRGKINDFCFIVLYKEMN